MAQNWRERIKPGVFTSPSGVDYPIVGTAYSRSRTLRGKAWEYAGVNGAYVQRRGTGAFGYPLRILFSGRDCDLEASAFEAAVSEPGFGSLMHPTHGLIRHAAVLGEVTRREDLIARGGEVVVECTFIDSLESVYPRTSLNAVDDVLATVDAFNAAAAAEFAGVADLQTLDLVEMTKAAVLGQLAIVKQQVAQASDFVSGSQARYSEQLQFVQGAIDILIGQPADLALAVCQTLQAPARAAAALESQVLGNLRTLMGAFGDILDAIIQDGDEPPITPAQRSNDFAVRDVTAKATVSASVVAAVTGGTVTRSSALWAATELERQRATLTAWRDEQSAALLATEGLSVLDTGAGYEALHRSVVAAIGQLLAQGFAVRPERTIVLGRPRQLIELAAELYGAIDNATLDRLINDNELTGSEILELPAGTEIVYSR